MPLDQAHDEPTPKKDSGEMSFFDHIAELRDVLFRSAVAIAVVGAVFFLNKDFVFSTLLFGPRHADFWTYRSLCWLGNQTGLAEQLCITPPQFTLIGTEMAEVLMQHLYLAFWLGVIGAFPYIFWQFWRFIAPGLHEKERRAAGGIVVVCSALFLSGVVFGYYIIAPFAISFLTGYTVEGVTISPKLDSYVTYMTMFTIPTGLVFELPIVAYFMAKIGIMGAKFMRTYRRHAIVVVFIIAAIITPPDVVSQTLVAIPLLFLYEASILVVQRVEKNRAAKLAADSGKDLVPMD